MDKKSFGSVFDDLGINMPEIYNPENVMPVRDYASFFRILYNASYLNRDMSEQALKLLSTVEYKNGLSGGIPQTVPLSHKFGERESLTDDKKVIRQLHDCGIVYHPKRPYLICVMTKGENFSDLSKAIIGISKLVYEQIDARSR
jgi:beta-lactamase class A